MKAVILAAGLCSRIHQVTKGMPKCLLRFGDRAILDYQIDSLFDAGITSLAIVVGYGKEYIIDHVPALSFRPSPPGRISRSLSTRRGATKP